LHWQHPLLEQVGQKLIAEEVSRATSGVAPAQQSDNRDAVEAFRRASRPLLVAEPPAGGNTMRRQARRVNPFPADNDKRSKSRPKRHE